MRKKRRSKRGTFRNPAAAAECYDRKSRLLLWGQYGALSCHLVAEPSNTPFCFCQYSLESILRNQARCLLGAHLPPGPWKVNCLCGHPLLRTVFLASPLPSPSRAPPGLSDSCLLPLIPRDWLPLPLSAGTGLAPW